MNRKQKIIMYLNTKYPQKAEYIIMILISLLLASFYLYNDIADSAANGIKFWNCLTDGTLPLFYSKRYTGVEGTILSQSGRGGYDFALYLIFAVYNFPLWIWEKLSGHSFVEFIWSREYIKGISWIFIGICSYLLYKLAVICGIDEEEAKWCPFLFMSSAIFFHAEVIMGGYDVISLAFTLLGLCAYLQGNDKGFVLSFAVAIAMKYFALWLFIPLVLLKEKRIWRIIVYGIEGISVVVIPKILFAIASNLYRQNNVGIVVASAVGGAAQAGGTEVSAMSLISHGDIVIDGALFPDSYIAQYTFLSLPENSLVLIGMCMIWLWCYLCKKQLSAQKLIYLCAATMSIFVLAVKQHPQWCILIVPYLVLIIMFHPEKMKDNLILEGVYSLGYLLNKSIMYSWTCNLNLIENMTMPQHSFSYGEPGVTGNVYGLSSVMRKVSELTAISEIHISYIFKAAAVAGLISFLIQNYPGKDQDAAVTDSGGTDYKQRRKWVYTRLALSCAWGVVPFVGLLIYLT